MATDNRLSLTIFKNSICHNSMWCPGACAPTILHHVTRLLKSWGYRLISLRTLISDISNKYPIIVNFSTKFFCDQYSNIVDCSNREAVTHTIPFPPNLGCTCMSYVLIQHSNAKNKTSLPYSNTETTSRCQCGRCHTGVVPLTYCLKKPIYDFSNEYLSILNASCTQIKWISGIEKTIVKM